MLGSRLAVRLAAGAVVLGAATLLSLSAAGRLSLTDLTGNHSAPACPTPSAWTPASTPSLSPGWDRGTASPAPTGSVATPSSWTPSSTPAGWTPVATPSLSPGWDRVTPSPAPTCRP